MLDAIAGASVILVCPSNPLVSIGPILAVPGVKEAITASAAPKVAVSPIIGGAPVKGPADKLMRGVGLEVSALGVARLYADWCDGFVIDEKDRALADAVASTGLTCAVTETLMRDGDVAEALARTALGLAEQRAA